MTERKVVGDFHPDRVLWFTRGGKAHLDGDCRYIEDDGTNRHPVKELHKDIEICGWCDSDYTVNNSMPRHTLASNIKKRVTVDEIDSSRTLWDVEDRGRRVMHMSPDCHHLSDNIQKHSAREVDNDMTICETCVVKNRESLCFSEYR